MLRELCRWFGLACGPVGLWAFLPSAPPDLRPTLLFPSLPCEYSHLLVRRDRRAVGEVKCPQIPSVSVSHRAPPNLGMAVVWYLGVVFGPDFFASQRKAQTQIDSKMEFYCSCFGFSILLCNPELMDTNHS